MRFAAFLSTVFFADYENPCRRRSGHCDRSTDVVPDIFRKVPVKDGWVKLATDLKKCERVRLIPNKKQGIHEILKTAPEGLRTDSVAEGEEVLLVILRTFVEETQFLRN